MRVILHADLDCFYAQVEQVRLGIKEDVPLVVQQWQSLIAVNYPARAYGITRHMSIAEAKQKCPLVVAVHTAAYQLPSASSLGKIFLKEFAPGSAPPASANHKVSLDAYRQASKGIFKLLRDRFGSRVVEKASVDEAYLDVSDLVDERMDNEFPDWRQWTGSVPADVELCWDDLGHPAVPAVVQLQKEEQNGNNLILEDIQIWIGALIAKELREEMKEALGYTCSIGIAPNKTLAKLASPQNKPNGQTFVAPRMVLPWMRTIPFDKIRFLGGKLGQQILSQDAAVEEESDSSEDEQKTSSSVVYAGDLWPLSLEEMQNKVGGDPQLALWVHNLIRGIDEAPVKPRALTKTFLSAKNLRPPVTSEELLERWVLVLATELQHRLEEEAVDTRRWPRNISLSYRKLDMASTRSKAVDFPFPPQSSTVEKICSHVLTRLVKPLLPLFPLSFIGITLGRFTEVGEDTRGIATLDAFAASKFDPFATSDSLLFPSSPKKKKTKSATTLGSAANRKVDISQFFQKKQEATKNTISCSNVCPKCNQEIGDSEEVIQEHQDFHFAMKLAGLEQS